jgi:polyisoprenoid-binding protein YceI
MKAILFSVIALLIAMPVQAKDYVVDKAKSRITFSGSHAGNAFEGSFEKWDAQISFDPANLPASSVRVTVDTASAKTGNAMYDGTLPTSDWFDAKAHPKAVFQSESIAAKEGGGFTAKGTLTIRQKTVPVQFDFAFIDAKATPLETSFTLTLDRLAFGLGEKSDAKAEWVSKDMALKIAVVASPR